MDYETQIADINLETLSWDAAAVLGGGGGGSDLPGVRPFIWTVFFTADGSTLSISDAGTVVGQAVIYPSLGSHLTLGWDNLHVGEQRVIPDAIGRWTGSVQPIPVAQSLQPILGTNFPATFGVVAVALVDAGHIPKHAIEAGHQALNNAVQNALDSLLAGLGPDHQSITDEDIAAITDGLKDTVINAVKDSLHWWEGLWALTDADYLIGYTALHWDQQDLADANGTINIVGVPDDPNNPVVGQQSGIISAFPNQWSVRGFVSAFAPCNAEAFADALLAEVPPPPPKPPRGPLPAMRAFRDGDGLRRYPGLASWWTALSLAMPDAIMLLRRSTEFRNLARRAFAQVEHALVELDRPLPDEMLNDIRRGLVIATEQGNPRLSALAREAHAAIAKLEVESTDGLLRALTARRKVPPRKVRGTGRSI